jgi:hypothetical protein
MCLVFVVVFMVILAVSAIPKKAVARPDAEMIADPRAAEADVLASIERLRTARPSDKEAKLWMRVANSTLYPDCRRRRAVFQLFDRFVRPGMKLTAIGDLLVSPTWLKSENVILVNTIAGWMPVDMVPGETVFVVQPRLPRDDSSGVYLRLKGSLRAEALYDGLMGRKPGTATREVTAISISPSDPADKRLVAQHRDPPGTPDE